MVRATVMAAILGAWLFPFVRAWRLFEVTSKEYAETRSANAWNDYSYSSELLASYTFSALIALLLTWLLFRTREWLLLIPLAACFGLAIYVEWLQPERVIVLFRDIPPMRPAAFSAVIALGAMLMRRLYRRADEEAEGSII